MKKANPVARRAASKTESKIIREAILAGQGAMISQPMVLISNALKKQ